MCHLGQVSGQGQVSGMIVTSRAGSTPYLHGLCPGSLKKKKERARERKEWGDRKCTKTQVLTNPQALHLFLSLSQNTASYDKINKRKMRNVHTSRCDDCGKKSVYAVAAISLTHHARVAEMTRCFWSLGTQEDGCDTVHTSDKLRV